MVKMVVMYDKFTAPKIQTSGQAPKVLVAVDIGNSGIKFGTFDRDACAHDLFGQAPYPRDIALLEPAATLELPISHAMGEFELNELARWCEAIVGSDTS